MTEMMIALPTKTDASALSAEATELVRAAHTLVVSNADDYARAGEFGKGVKALRAEIDKRLDPNIARWHDGHKAAIADKRLLTDVLDEAERITKSKMLDFQHRESARLDAERREHERAAKKLEEDRRMQEALDLDSDGDRAGAEAILAEPIVAPVISTRPKTPKVSGVSTVRRWTFEHEIDVTKVLCFIAGVERLAHPELAGLLTVDTKTTQQYVTALKDQFGVPGIRVYQVDSMSFGSR